MGPGHHSKKVMDPAWDEKDMDVFDLIVKNRPKLWDMQYEHDIKTKAMEFERVSQTMGQSG